MLLLLGAIAVLVTATMQWLGDTARIRQKALVKKVTTVAPLPDGWQLELPAGIEDPRTIQVWDAKAAQHSVAAQDAASGFTGQVLQGSQNLVLIKGTDGKNETQALALIDAQNGQAAWSKIYNDLPLDYCLPEMWQSSVVCESRQARKVVKIDPAGNITIADLPGGIWDLATGEHVISTVFDKFLVVPLGISQGDSAGVEAQFIKPDFTYWAKFQALVPNSTAAKPLLAQSRGAITLLGVLTSAADGSNRQYTWKFSQLLNLKQGSLDLTNLGDAPQASLLEAGFFASSDPQDEGPNPGTWRLYNPDGSVNAEGQAPLAALQAMHSQLRQGLTLDITAATKALQSGKVSAIMPDKSYFLAASGETCATWQGCAATVWTTGDGVEIKLKDPGRPLMTDSKTIVFKTASELLGYGVVDGKLLWEGVTPPLENAAMTGEPRGFATGIAQLAQIGEDENATGILKYWPLP